MDRLRTMAVWAALAVTSLSVYADRQSDKDLQPIAIRVDGRSVKADGLTPGGASVVVISWPLSVSGMSGISETWRDARADDAGSLSVAFGSVAPAGGFTAVVDVTTGRLAIDTGDGNTFTRVELPPSRLKRNAQREVDHVVTPQPAAMIIVVRPGEGAWVQRADDGARGDADGIVDGRIIIDPSVMKAIAESGPPPKKIKARDTILMVDLQGGTYASTEVTQ